MFVVLKEFDKLAAARAMTVAMTVHTAHGITRLLQRSQPRAPLAPLTHQQRKPD